MCVSLVSPCRRCVISGHRLALFRQRVTCFMFVILCNRLFLSRNVCETTSACCLCRPCSRHAPFDVFFLFFKSHLWVKPKTQPALHLGMNLNDLTARLTCSRTSPSLASVSDRDSLSSSRAARLYQKLTPPPPSTLTPPPGDSTLDLPPHCSHLGWMRSRLCRHNPSLNSHTIC